MLSMSVLLFLMSVSGSGYSSPFLHNAGALQGCVAMNVTAVKIKMLPNESQAPAKGKPYKLGKSLRLKVVVTNNSDSVIKAYVVDTYYQNRPQLYKDGHLIPYRGAVSELVRSKDTDFEFTRVGEIVLLQPTTTTALEEIDLKDWYDPLKPGTYKLINRHRFNIDGSWSADSAELLFEIASQD